MIARLDLDGVRGDEFREVVQVLDEDGDPLNIAAWSALTAQIRAGPDETPPTAITAAIADAPTGLITLAVTAAAMALLRGVYHWDLERTEAGAKETKIGGYFRVRADVTKP